MMDFSGITHTVLIRGKFIDSDCEPTHISTGIHDLSIGECVAVHIWRQPGDDFLNQLEGYQLRTSKVFHVYRSHAISLDTREVEEELEYIVIRTR